MASTTTQTSIANRALQIVGYQTISSIAENSRGARAINRCYQPILLDTLRENLWSFAIMRISLAKAATAPAFELGAYYPLPGDFLFMAPADHNDSKTLRDWTIENTGTGLAIATDDKPPIYLRYVSSNVTESQFDVSFCEAFAANLAAAVCEELTQSTAKLQAILQLKKDALEAARKRNAIERGPEKAPLSTWLSVRL